MPARDVRPVASNSRGGSGRSSSGGSYYDDEGRGASKDLWEWFQNWFTIDPTLDRLLSLDDRMCYQCLTRSVGRYGLEDIAHMREPGWFPGDDTRAHRLVLEYRLKEDDWVLFHLHLVEGYNRHKDALEEHRRAESEDSEKRWAEYRARVEAERLEVARQDQLEVSKIVEMTAGMLQSELNQVFISNDKVGDAGDWIEETVDTYQDGSGFGYEQDKATGIKLQITVSLDLSNSMYYNGVHQVAAACFRDLCLSLKAMKAEYPDDLYTAFFTFSDNDWEGDGKHVVRFETPRVQNEGDYFGEFSLFRPSNIAARHIFTGTDTWMAPLFAKIEKFENSESDPGAVRLDIVITDAVMEHKKDIRESDIIQERRNGSLQTVFVNFLKPEEAINSTLPKRCFQMFADKDNVAGLLRQVIAEFVGAHV